VRDARGTAAGRTSLPARSILERLRRACCPFPAAFAYTLVVSLLAGYVARATVAPGAEYPHVFQVVGAASWLAYAWSIPADSIWMGKPWSSTFVYRLDGLIYASLTAGSFAWLWPKVAGA